jgi:plasmid maintenance system antidote protein VapI
MDILKTIKKEIENSSKSRYQISKDTGITEGQLHRIIKKNQSLYCETAEKLLDYFGYGIIKKRDKK